MKYKIKNDVKLNELQKYGYKYTGNYNRGEVWEKEIDIIIENKNLGGILIDDFREISFKFPYVKDIKYPNIELYIEDLIQAGLVEKYNKDK